MIDILFKQQLTSSISDALDEAEATWATFGERLVNESRDRSIKLAAQKTTRIPGHSTLKEGESKLDEFICLMLDMRNSSEHLMCALSNPENVSELRRVFYEVSALLPAMELCVDKYKGSVTEYLGDGILALFNVPSGNKESAIYSSYNAAQTCMDCVSEVINPMIQERYSLPPISIGIGLSMSKGIVSMVGNDGNRHPKVFGECVYRASKLSKGNNQIFADEKLNQLWPKEEGGVLSIKSKKLRDFEGYLIERNR